jgi:hypothetical protein
MIVNIKEGNDYWSEIEAIEPPEYNAYHSWYKKHYKDIYGKITQAVTSTLKVIPSTSGLAVVQCI